MPPPVPASPPVADAPRLSESVSISSSSRAPTTYRPVDDDSLADGLEDTGVDDPDDVEQTSTWNIRRDGAPAGMVPSNDDNYVLIPGDRREDTRMAPGVDESQRPTMTTDANWRTRAASGFTAYEGLSEPGGEHPRLRLTLGRVVPGTRYRILKWLGEGGMGVVYEAEHIDIERRVALKILRFDLSCQPQMTRVFRDEARAATRIGSPYIVDIFDFGELTDGRLYFCMELIDGRDLVPETTEAWIEPATLIGHLRQICKGLGDAHAAGIVHRDIKPENILAYNKDGRQAIKLVDFGISAMLAVTGSSSSNGAGTPHYMAPEQVSGAEFDGRLDMYALGCTAYELLTGYPPFDCEDVGELLGRHLTEEPRSLHEARPDREFPKALAAVVMRCLNKRPADRYVDMADLEAALCEAQIAAGLHTPWDDLPLPEVDPERRERLLDLMPGPAVPRQRRRWVWPSIAATSTLAAVGLAIVIAIWGLLNRRRARAQWGDIRQGLWINLIRWAAAHIRPSTHAKGWRPNILVLAGSPTKRWYLIDLANAMSHGRGLLTIATIVPDPTPSQRKRHLAETVREHLAERKVDALVRVVSAPTPYVGASVLVEAYGLGGLVPNTVLLGDAETTSDAGEYAAMIRRIARTLF